VSKPTICANQIRLALREHWPSGAYAVVEEVRSRTGYGRTSERYADALVCSCWPSRGLWIAGVEIKVSRSDWQREIREPEKSAEIQRWCSRWWVAAPVGLVLDGELPVTWGLIEYDPESRAKDKLRVRTEAPELTPEPLSIGFVASLMRSVAKGQDSIAKDALRAAKDALSVDLGANVDELKSAVELVAGLQKQLTQEQTRHWETERKLMELRRLVGLRADGNGDIGEALRIAKSIRDTGYQTVASRLREAAMALDALQGDGGS